MKKFSHRIKWGKLLVTAAALIACYQLVCCSLPYLRDGLTGVMVIAGGISYPSGGQALLESALQTDHDDADATATQTATAVDWFADWLFFDSPLPDFVDEDAAVYSLDSFVDQQEPEKTAVTYPVVTEDLSTTTSILVGNAYIRNDSDYSDSEVLAMASADNVVGFFDTDEPQVLIYHTHATESFLPAEMDWYPDGFTFRDTDNDNNMVAVGEVLATQLEAAGIGVIHATEQHDNPSYTGAYTRSRLTIEEYLELYPSITVVLDLHRDAIQADDGTAWSVCTEVDGLNVAQLMLIVCADDGAGSNPYDAENLAFATALVDQMESDYSSLCRAILFSERYYNQDLSTGSILVEVGSHANTLAQAQRAILLFGEALIAVLG